MDGEEGVPRKGAGHEQEERGDHHRQLFADEAMEEARDDRADQGQ